MLGICRGEKSYGIVAEQDDVRASLKSQNKTLLGRACTSVKPCLLTWLTLNNGRLYLVMVKIPEWENTIELWL